MTDIPNYKVNGIKRFGQEDITWKQLVISLVLAGEQINWDCYEDFKQDLDGIILINDDSYFKDDIVEQFIHWLESAFGKENAEENMKYIS